MKGFLLRRVAASALLLFVVLTTTFLFIHLAPGDPFRFFADPRVPAEQNEHLRRIYGLDRPLIVQYASWLRAIVLEGDWGQSLSAQRPAAEIVARALPNTLILGLATAIVLYGVGITTGMLAALHAGRTSDRAIRIVSLLLYGVPAFYLGLLAIELFAVRWPLLPANQMSSTGSESWPLWARTTDVLRHLVLPAVTLGLAGSGAITRFVRNGLLEVLGQDYVRTAHAKGLSPARVLWVHALPNVLGPVVQNLGVALPMLLNGTLIIEVIFGWPGLGRVAFEAILARDYPVILAGTALSGVLVICGNFGADLLHAWLDPRVRGD